MDWLTEMILRCRYYEDEGGDAGDYWDRPRDGLVGRIQTAISAICIPVIAAIYA
jgi:hypothetical protein